MSFSLKNFVATTIREYLNEGINNANLILYHGSNNHKLYDKFYDNQFFTVNDYIASNYAYNQGGLLYKVVVNKLNPLSLVEEPERMANIQGVFGKGGPYLSGSDYYIRDIIEKLYGNDRVKLMAKYGMGGKLATIIGGDFAPLIKWAKKQGYDSLKFYDESFDTFIQDVTYIVFDGDKPKITDIYDIKDAVESDFSKEFKKIK